MDSMGVAADSSVSHTPSAASACREARETAIGRGANAAGGSAVPVAGSASRTRAPQSESAQASAAPIAPPPAIATS